MRSIKKCRLILCCLLLCSACSTATQPTPVATANPNLRLETISSSSPTKAVPTSSVEEYLLLRIPRCEGLKLLDHPLKFNWPNIEDRIKEIGGALWGYYSCEQPQGDVATFYLDNTPAPPYNLEQVNWVERVEGDVGVYYNAGSSAWIYIWIVPQPEDPSKTFVIVAESLEPITGGC